jgi:phosphatidylglycerophosphatase A
MRIRGRPGLPLLGGSPLGTSERAAVIVATWGGIGLLGRGRGTWAALTAVPLFWAVSAFGGPAACWALLVAIVAAGTWGAAVVVRATGDHDPQIVVVDEVAGALLAVLIVNAPGSGAEIGALLLFRLLDIAKPWPIGALERLRSPAVATMADDVAAGALAGILLVLLYS